MSDYESVLKTLYDELNSINELLNSLIVSKNKQNEELTELNNKRNICFNEECKRISSTLWQYKCLFDSKKSLRTSTINIIIGMLITILSVLSNIYIFSLDSILSLVTLISILFSVIQTRNIITSSKEIKRENELLNDNDKDYHSLEKELEEKLELLRMLEDNISNKERELNTTEDEISECMRRINLIKEQILSIKVNIANEVLDVHDEETFNHDTLVLSFRNKNNL